MCLSPAAAGHSPAAGAPAGHRTTTARGAAYLGAANEGMHEHGQRCGHGCKPSRHSPSLPSNREAGRGTRREGDPVERPDRDEGTVATSGATKDQYRAEAAHWQRRLPGRRGGHHQGDAARLFNGVCRPKPGSTDATASHARAEAERHSGVGRAPNRGHLDVRRPGPGGHVRSGTKQKVSNS